MQTLSILKISFMTEKINEIANDLKVNKDLKKIKRLSELSKKRLKLVNDLIKEFKQ